MVRIKSHFPEEVGIKAFFQSWDLFWLITCPKRRKIRR
jgi:hypothetical protein